ncbi:nucleoprotein [Heartland virus]|uniref:Nucleoprotein n=1 Tax=Heartland virus TaxID=1216928 RepID=J3SPZ7_HTRV|nr:nucleoprotein [Heartland virus]AFP33389.1 nucleoprotein [Heartland virus]
MTDWSAIAVEIGNEPLDVPALVEFAKEIAYEGLDPAVIFGLLRERGGENWRNDVKYIIVFALTRGNKIVKACGKMSKKGAERMTNLARVYELKENAVDRMAVTPVRVAQCLPTWTCAAAAAIKEYLPVGPAIMHNKIQGYPLEMMCMAFGSLIPQADVSIEVIKDFMDAYSLWQDTFARTINVDQRKMTKAEVYAKFRDPLHAAVNSLFFPNATRISWLQAKGLLTATKEASGSVKAAAAAYRNM